MRKHVETTRTRRLCAAMIVATAAAAFAAHAPTTEPNAVTITATKLEVTDKALEWHYQITNRSSQDIWICESISAGRPDFEVYVPDGSQTLTIRRRFDIPTEATWAIPPRGRYVRLPAGQARSESVLLSVPVRPACVFSWPRRHWKETLQATELAIEIDYYRRNPFEVVLDLLYEAETSSKAKRDDGILWGLGGSRVFTRHNEAVRDRDEATSITYPFQHLGAEHVSEIVKRGLSIPYTALSGRSPLSAVEQEPDLASSCRVEIVYEPSMLDYFFPGTSEQSLLSSEEAEYLRQARTSVWDSPQQIRAFAAEIRQGRPHNVAVSGSSARVSFYCGDESIASLVIYGDKRVLGVGHEPLSCYPDIASFREFTREISPFESRIRCAGNLKNLWYRLRVDLTARQVHAARSAKNQKVAHPSPAKWCEILSLAYERTTSQKFLLRPYKCPAAGEGLSHYAMNPNCRADSPGDMVLLFETKAGWNQHGGPELFTFDNHDPKGGCVLLNDGTVKFIRTKQELHALRWE